VLVEVPSGGVRPRLLGAACTLELLLPADYNAMGEVTRTPTKTTGPTHEGSLKGKGAWG
jgi:hypothetical protein